MSTLAALYAEIEKAGLIRPGKRPLLHRVGFLLSTMNDRKQRIGRYLEGRKRGLGYGPKGKRRRRTGTYTGVYATGVNKSGAITMDAVDALYTEIEKAARRGGPRSGLIPYGSRHQYGRAKFFEARAKRNGETLSPRAQRAKGYLANRFRGGKGPKGSTRRAFYKSEQAMSNEIDNLYEAIEKAKGLIPRGGSSKLARRIWRRPKEGGNSARGDRVVRYLGDRHKYGRVAAGSGGKRYAGYYESRRGHYK